jgi:hypothetical protein
VLCLQNVKKAEVEINNEKKRKEDVSRERRRLQQLLDPIDDTLDRLNHDASVAGVNNNLYVQECLQDAEKAVNAVKKLLKEKPIKIKKNTTNTEGRSSGSSGNSEENENGERRRSSDVHVLSKHNSVTGVTSYGDDDHDNHLNVMEYGTSAVAEALQKVEKANQSIEKARSMKSKEDEER